MRLSILVALLALAALQPGFATTVVRFDNRSRFPWFLTVSSEGLRTIDLHPENILTIAPQHALQIGLKEPTRGSARTDLTLWDQFGANPWGLFVRFESVRPVTSQPAASKIHLWARPGVDPGLYQRGILVEGMVVTLLADAYPPYPAPPPQVILPWAPVGTGPLIGPVVHPMTLAFMPAFPTQNPKPPLTFGSSLGAGFTPSALRPAPELPSNLPRPLERWPGLPAPPLGGPIPPSGSSSSLAPHPSASSEATRDTATASPEPSRAPRPRKRKKPGTQGGTGGEGPDRQAPARHRASVSPPSWASDTRSTPPVSATPSSTASTPATTSSLPEPTPVPARQPLLIRNQSASDCILTFLDAGDPLRMVTTGIDGDLTLEGQIKPKPGRSLLIPPQGELTLAPLGPATGMPWTFRVEEPLALAQGRPAGIYTWTAGDGKGQLALVPGWGAGSSSLLGDLEEPEPLRFQVGPGTLITIPAEAPLDPVHVPYWEEPDPN